VLASPSTFTLSTGELQSFANLFPEPAPGLWDFAFGQLFDPNTDSTCGQYPYFLRARIQRRAFLATLAAS
jgi:hypothetical protein